MYNLQQILNLLSYRKKYNDLILIKMGYKNPLHCIVESYIEEIAKNHMYYSNYYIR